MNHDLRCGADHRCLQGVCVEHVGKRRGNAGSFERSNLCSASRDTGDMVTGGDEQRRQPPTDCAAGASEKNPHAIISRSAVERMQRFGDFDRV
jgi:hypothetical protein